MRKKLTAGMLLCLWNALAYAQSNLTPALSQKTVLILEDAGSAERTVSAITASDTAQQPNADTLFQLGKLKNHRQEYQAAIQTLHQLLQIQPNYTAVLEERAKAFLALNEFAQADADSTVTLENNRLLDALQGNTRQNAALLLLRGDTRIAAGRKSEGLHDYKDAIRQNPAWVLPYSRLALAYCSLNENLNAAIAEVLNVWGFEQTWRVLYTAQQVLKTYRSLQFQQSAGKPIKEPVYVCF